MNWLALASCLLVTSCSVTHDPLRPGAVRSYPPPVFGAADSVFSDDQLLAAIYSPYTYPPGFYQEPPTRVAPYYVNTVSIAPLCCRTEEWRELSTDDPAQARAWADSSVAYSSNVETLDTTAIVTEKYIEFRPGPVTSPNLGVPMRAHRLAYIDRWMRDRFHPDSLEGRLNARPLDAAATRGVAEYLWYLEQRQIYGSKVLSSFGRDDPGSFVQVLFHTQLNMGDWNMCDQINLFRSEYRVNKRTGDIVRRDVLVRSVSGECH
jgi:hypothetical protein